MIKKIFLLSCTLFLLSLVACKKEDNTGLVLKITGDVSANTLYLKIWDPVKDYFEETTIDIMGRDLSPAANPLYIRMQTDGGDMANFADEVVICAIGFGDMQSVAMSYAVRETLDTSANRIIEIPMQYTRLDWDADCFSPQDEAFYDCNDFSAKIYTGHIESCDDEVDNNCDGIINEECPCREGAERPCYPAEYAKYEGVGACVSGKQVCHDSAFGECQGYVLPAEEICNNHIDENCDGTADEGCECEESDVLLCWMGKNSRNINDLTYIDSYGGRHFPKGTDTNICRAGRQYCAGGRWSECTGDLGINGCSGKDCEPSLQLWHELVCDGVDNDCDGQTDENDYSKEIIADANLRRDFDADNDGYNTCGSRNHNGELVPPNPDFADCMDDNPSVNPGAMDLCYSNLDNNCDGEKLSCMANRTCGNYGYLAVGPNNDCYKSAENFGKCNMNSGLCNTADDECSQTGQVANDDRPEYIRPKCQDLVPNTCSGKSKPVYQNVADKTDPFGDCKNEADKVSCGSFYYGWDGASCYAKNNTGNIVGCHDGACMTAADFCPTYNEKAAAPIQNATCGSSLCKNDDACKTNDAVSDSAKYCITSGTTIGCNNRNFCNANSECVTRPGVGCDANNPCTGGLFCVDGVCCLEACDGLCEKCDNTGHCGVDMLDNQCKTDFVTYKNNGGVVGDSTCQGGFCTCSERGKCDGGIIGSVCLNDNDCGDGLGCACHDAQCSQKICVPISITNVCRYYTFDPNNLVESLKGGYLESGNNGPDTGCLAPGECDGSGNCLNTTTCINDNDCISGTVCTCGDSSCSVGRCVPAAPEACHYVDQYGSAENLTLSQLEISINGKSNLTKCEWSCFDGACKKDLDTNCSSDDECHSGICSYASPFLNNQLKCVDNEQVCHYYDVTTNSLIAFNDGIIDPRCNGSVCENGACGSKANGQTCGSTHECYSGNCECADANCSARQCTERSCGQCKYPSNAEEQSTCGNLAAYVQDLSDLCLNYNSNNYDGKESGYTAKRACNGSGGCGIINDEICGHGADTNCKSDGDSGGCISDNYEKCTDGGFINKYRRCRAN